MSDELEAMKEGLLEWGLEPDAYDLLWQDVDCREIDDYTVFDDADMDYYGDYDVLDDIKW